MGDTKNYIYSRNQADFLEAGHIMWPTMRIPTI